MTSPLTLEVRNLDNRMAYMLHELRTYGITESDGGVEGHAVNSYHVDHVARPAHEQDQGRSALSSPPKYKAAGIESCPSDTTEQKKAA